MTAGERVPQPTLAVWATPEYFGRCHHDCKHLSRVVGRAPGTERYCGIL